MAEEVKKEETIKEKETSEKKEAVESEEKFLSGDEKESKAGEDKKTETIELAKKKKKIRRQILRAQAHVNCTYNNTMITISDLNGAVLGWASSGLLGFKSAKKATPFAATQVTNSASEKVKKFGIQEMEVYIKGIGGGREASIRALANNDFNIVLIKDVTPIPHNGCRPRKPRRV
jgi:small subunit ribosomal protein S11